MRFKDIEDDAVYTQTLFADDKAIIIDYGNRVEDMVKKPLIPKEKRIAEQLMNLGKEIGRIDGIQRSLMDRMFMSRKSIDDIRSALWDCTDNAVRHINRIMDIMLEEDGKE